MLKGSIKKRSEEKSYFLDINRTFLGRPIMDSIFLQVLIFQPLKIKGPTDR